MMSALVEAHRWRAVLERDSRYDDAFVYAVKTTNVFCKPSCSSRRPRKENVRFFRSGQAAIDAGYRECAKCRPMSGQEAERIVRSALEFLENSLDERTTLTDLAKHVALSPFHLQRLFKRHVGVSPRMYVATRRAERLKANLRNASSVASASLNAGYADERGAYGDAFRSLGMTPGQYRRRGDGKSIGYKVIKTPIGQALIAATPRGIAAIYLGDNVEQLEADLRAEYPAAKITRYSSRAADIKAQLDSAERTVREQLRGHERIRVSFDVEGTPFQSKVWRALTQIPFGETRTYQEVARLIGRSGSSRAVAQACASNKIALVIPCHRVVRSDGNLANYRWGADRKRELLALEKAG